MTAHRCALLVSALYLAHSYTGAQPAVPEDIRLVATGAGWLFTDTAGMTLYSYDPDEGGKSTCYEECLKTWTPLTASDDVSVNVLPEWSVTIRDDDVRQWTFRGRPLYRFTEDTHPGATYGDAPRGPGHAVFEAIWTPAELSTGETLLGRVLTDDRGMTVYLNKTETVASGSADAPAGVFALESGCHGRCLDTWRPVPAPWIAVSAGDWTIVRRPDGTRQWAYRGKPLYTYARDMAPGDTRGQDAPDAWRAYVLEPASDLPGWVTVQGSDAGELLADRQGLTIYAFDVSRNQARRSNLSAPATCDEECMRTYWQSVLAKDAQEPMGNWTTVRNEDGQWQWAYKGQPLYTHTRDTKPGDINGTRFVSSRAWTPIMRSGQPMQGLGGN